MDSNLLSSFIKYADRTARFVIDRRESANLSKTFREKTKALVGAQAFDGLLPVSLSLANVQNSSVIEPCINIVLPELKPSAIFAGIKTALEFSVKLAEATGRPLRILVSRNGPDDRERLVIANLLREEYGLLSSRLHFASGIELSELVCSSEDRWIATHWTTAHAIEVAARLDRINPNDVIYLIQDYEAGFYPWSSSFALARATYHAGFCLVVNSAPLREFLVKEEGLEIDDKLVFAPSVDLLRAQEVSKRRNKSDTARVMFYARPSKPRNLFDIGVAALKIAASELATRGVDVKFVSAGEKHPRIPLSRDQVLSPLGKLSWDEYFTLLGDVDVVLSLQHSPHPSHPPLDAVSSGAIAVTNELGGTRGGLHPMLLVAEPNPVSLASRVVDAVLMIDTMRARFDGDFIATMGLPLETVVQNVALKLGLR